MKNNEMLKNSNPILKRIKKFQNQKSQSGIWHLNPKITKSEKRNAKESPKERIAAKESRQKGLPRKNLPKKEMNLLRSEELIFLYVVSRGHSGWPTFDGASVVGRVTRNVNDGGKPESWNYAAQSSQTKPTPLI